MQPAEIPWLSATQLGSLIAAKELSPLDAVAAYLARIEQVDPQLNAYITVCADAARQQARQAETEIARGQHRGPLHGVPVAIKDQIHTKGIPTTDASKLRAAFIPAADATVVTRLYQAGAILLGKLNMSEFAMGDPISSY